MDYKLLVFDRTTKKCVGIHNDYDITWVPIEDYWLTYDWDTQKGIIILKSVIEENESAQVINPSNWDSQSNFGYTYIDKGETSAALIRGYVKKQSDSTPIEGATVDLEISSIVKYTTTTDVNGYYEINLIYPDTYDLKISKTGYVDYTENDLVIYYDAATDNGDILLTAV
jgi:hypothetical protein